MDTKSKIIDIATTLFQQKGYKGTGLNEILKTCNIAKGSLYHYFPNGKEELLIACLQAMKEEIMTEMVNIFKRYPTTDEAVQAMTEKLIDDYERKGTIAGYTFNSIVSEMASLSEPVRNACWDLYRRIQGIISKKLVEDGYAMEKANSLALMVVASVEGGMLLCLTQKSSDPLKTILHGLSNLIKGLN